MGSLNRIGENMKSAQMDRKKIYYYVLIRYGNLTAQEDFLFIIPTEIIDFVSSQSQIKSDLF